MPAMGVLFVVERAIDILLSPIWPLLGIFFAIWIGEMGIFRFGVVSCLFYCYAFKATPWRVARHAALLGVVLVITPMLLLGIERAIDTHTPDFACGTTENNITAVASPLMETISRDHLQLWRLQRREVEQYCNIDQVQKSLFSTATIDRIEMDGMWGLVRQQSEQAHTEAGCIGWSSEKTLFDQHDEGEGDNEQAIILSRLRLNKLNGMQEYRDGPDAAMEQLCDASHKMQAALRSLPARPGFWDNDHVYSSDLKQLMHLKQYMGMRFARLQGVIQAVLSNQAKYDAARRAAAEFFLRATPRLIASLEQFQRQRTGKGNGQLDEDQFERDLRQYQAAYPLMGPMDDIVGIVLGSWYVRAGTVARLAHSNAQRAAEHMMGKHRFWERYCAPIEPLTRSEVEQWTSWMTLLGCDHGRVPKEHRSTL